MSERPRARAAVRLAQEIVSTIYDEGMEPGRKYLSEAEALAHHGVARGTYREAVRFLEMQGVLSLRVGPGGGPVISRPTFMNLASSIALLMQFADAPLRTLLEARVAIEPGMADLAARNATAEEIEQMGLDLDEVEANIGEYRKFSAAYLAFWDHLAKSTHNALLAFLSPAMRAIVDSAGFVPNEPYRLEILARLREIHAAVADHDPEAARASMEELELRFLDRLTKNYPRQVDRVVAWSDLDIARMAE